MAQQASAYSQTMPTQPAQRPEQHRFVPSFTSFIALAFVALYSNLVLAQTCSIPGNVGVGTVTAYNNGLYPGTVGTNVAAGATSVAVGTLRTGTAVKAGDLLMIIQMQGATINSTNSNQYGDGSGSATSVPTGTNANAAPSASDQTDVFGSGSYAGGSTANTAGTYEYVVATGPASAGGLIPIASPLVNAYTNTAATATQGQTRYQVVVINQYSSATYSGTHDIPPWDGASGGIAVIDVAGALTLNALTINGNARGFRGGGAVNQNATCTGGATTTACQDYRSPNGASGTAVGAFKGEGIAGTPAWVYGFNSAGTAQTNSGNAVGADGYPNGDRSRGAPANAGGGGNQHNAGGGGGGNGGAGGKGGRSWNATVTPFSGLEVGGYGGASGYNSAPRLIMGGGGGAGDQNNGNATDSAGGAGGALVIIRAGSIAGGTATINLNGGNGQNSVGTDAAGGGGAGGTLMVTTGTGAATGITLNAAGGNGGFGAMGGNVETDGPGGGGGGGQLLTNGGGTANVGGGIAGTLLAAQGNTSNTTCNTAGNGTTGTGGFCGATNGITGATTAITAPTNTGAQVGYQCLPNITATKTTSTPVRDALGATTATYSITLTNSGGGARNVSVFDNALPPGWTLAAAPTYTYVLAPPLAANNLPSGAMNTAVGAAIAPTNTAPATVPAVGANTLTWNDFFIAPVKNGAPSTITIDFTVNIPATAPVGCYHNPAGFSFLDSTRTTAGAARLVTPTTNNSANRLSVPYAANVNYETLATAATTPVAGSNFSGLAGGLNTEDVCIRPDLVITKTNSNAAPAVGVGFNYIITARNNGHPIADTTFAADQATTQTAAAKGPALTNWVSDTLPTGIVLTAAPTGTNWTCTGTAGSVSFTCTYLGTGTGAYPWAGQTDLAGTITVPVKALNTACPAVAKINTAALGLAQFVGTTGAASSGESNAANNNATDGAGITPNCNIALTVTKTDGQTTTIVGQSLTYTFGVSNAGPAWGDGAVLSDPVGTGITKTGAVACTYGGGAAGPAAPTIAQLEAGFAITTLPPTGTVSCTVSATVN